MASLLHWTHIRQEIKRRVFKRAVNSISDFVGGPGRFEGASFSYKSVNREEPEHDKNQKFYEV